LWFYWKPWVGNIVRGLHRQPANNHKRFLKQCVHADPGKKKMHFFRLHLVAGKLIGLPNDRTSPDENNWMTLDFFQDKTADACPFLLRGTKNIGFWGIDQKKNSA
jgi:hypothetical protein